MRAPRPCVHADIVFGIRALLTALTQSPAATDRGISSTFRAIYAERGLAGTQLDALTRERDQLRTRVAQLMKIVSRRT